MEQLTSFGNLRRIRLDVLSITDATDVLTKLKNIAPRRPFTSVAVHVLDANPEQDVELNTVGVLVNVMTAFLRAEFASMDSFVVVVDGIGWADYHRLLTALLSMIESGHIFDGYLQFNVSPKYGRSITGSVDKSLRIAQLVTKMQTAMQQYNEQLEATDYNEKKLILNLPSLMLHAQHREFLRFWFGDDKSLYDGQRNSQRFVLN